MRSVWFIDQHQSKSPLCNWYQTGNILIIHTWVKNFAPEDQSSTWLGSKWTLLSAGTWLWGEACSCCWPSAGGRLAACSREFLLSAVRVLRSTSCSWGVESSSSSCSWRCCTWTSACSVWVYTTTTTQQTSVSAHRWNRTVLRNHWHSLPVCRTVLCLTQWCFRVCEIFRSF